MKKFQIAACALLLLFACLAASADQTVISDRLHHLRIDGPREWSDFPEMPEAASLQLTFQGTSNEMPATLRLRQQDVKQQWQVVLNDKPLGRLHVDENDMVVYFAVPPESLLDGDNRLRIEQSSRRRIEDIRVGEIVLHDRDVDAVLSAGSVEIQVIDRADGQPLPCRITVMNHHGALQTPGAESSDHLAVRPGVIYTSTGRATFGLPAGDYTIYAGRGFEYSLDHVSLSVAAGETTRKKLSIRREVPTEGCIACDTHVHTRTHSGHGDATVQERMITLAAEGIELPITTDHNVHIDHNPFARKQNVRRYFTPVIGNEVTTRTGHFNIFPVVAGSTIPDFKSNEWKVTLDNIFATPGAKVAILNHARDIHGGTRPFGPKLFNDVVGENLEEWHMGFNAMEVINSGATQTEPLRLFHDWMALLNRGYSVTPVGSSDSHDVARHFVGQGRTYIRCDDRDPGNIDVEQAVNNFLQGRVMISYGLLTEMKVNGRYGAGELARVPGDEITLDLRVLGPHWTKADKIMLFANGQLIREEPIRNVSGDRLPMGVLWHDRWTIPRPKHDVHLTAIATGPGIEELYWRTAKPYQPVTPDPKTNVIGCSGAIWLDVDSDGRRTSAHDYAQRLFTLRKPLPELIESLADYDASVAAQSANFLQRSGKSLLAEDVRDALETASPATRLGFSNYIAAWRANQLAQAADN